MKRTWILALALGFLAPIGFVGCAEETKVESKEKVSTPTGSETKTTTTETEKTGDQKANP